MTNSASIYDRIKALAAESATHGDLEMVALCERADHKALRDSRTTETVGPEELFGHVPMVGYVLAICDSLDAGPDGHISVRGRMVYAD